MLLERLTSLQMLSRQARCEMAKSVLIGTVDQIPIGEGRNFEVASEQIAVFRTHGGEVFATQASCPHRNGPLADGLLGGATIVCPLHDRSFDLRTGEEIGVECSKLKTFKVSVTDDRRMLIML
jgi:nitrite reductase (NADH) small subunit